jgi:diguanylate cyclase (GGDEF)-like protein/PAS domain S-box-containing protein
MVGNLINKWHGLGVQKKLHILIQGSLIILFLISMEWVIARFERQIMAAAEVGARNTADGLINGMNMLMLTGAISSPENREMLLKKMRQEDGVKEVRIIRGKSVVAQFGTGLPGEQPVDEMDREVLATGKSQIKKIDVKDGVPLLRVVVPFIALTDFRGTNCLTCHKTSVGEANGAASVTIDLGKDEAALHEIKSWLWTGHIVIQIFLSILISWFVRSLIVRNIAEPVKKLQMAMSEIHRENDLSKRADVDETNPDIGEMARTFNALVENLEHATARLELFGKMFHGSSEAILITDADQKIVAVNPAFTEITGYGAEETIGRNVHFMNSDKHSPALFHTMSASLNETGQWQGEVWLQRKSGEIYPIRLSIGVIKNNKNDLMNYITSFLDITERKATEQQIEFLAHYDVLTKLPNRALFADRLKSALLAASRSEKNAALLFLDLDKFKTINDTMGHLAGDVLLQSVAERLKTCVRETDTICRQGGDEFLILLSVVGSRDDVENVAKKIIAAMENPHQILGQEVVVSFSVGISIFPDDADDAEAIIKCADEAMYCAKESGRNNYKFF